MPDPQEPLSQSHLADAYWIARAEEAIRSGFLSPEESAARLLARYEDEKDVAKHNTEAISNEG